MMNINGYYLLGELRNDNSGYSKWGFANRNGTEVFIKEFLSPKYPLDDTLLSEKQSAQKKAICHKFEKRKSIFYNQLSKCSTGNIVTVKNFFRFENKYYMVTDKISTETLRPYEICRLPHEQKILIFKVILHSVKSLHEHNIVHGDLKPNNILFKRTELGFYTAKIIDFDSGFLETDPPENDSELQGDQVYLAPESFLFMIGENDTLTQKIDVFALGILFHQYWCGEMPGFDKSEYDYIFEAILNDAIVTINPSVPQPISELILKMLSKNPADRPSVKDIFSWFSSPDNISSIPVTHSNPRGLSGLYKAGNL